MKVISGRSDGIRLGVMGSLGFFGFSILVYYLIDPFEDLPWWNANLKLSYSYYNKRRIKQYELLNKRSTKYH